MFAAVEGMWWSDRSLWVSLLIVDVEIKMLR